MRRRKQETFFFIFSLLCTSRLLDINKIYFVLVKDLSAMHDKHLNRPTLDDNVDEEHTIEITTKEITQVKI